jgi:hypothetical protein
MKRIEKTRVPFALQEVWGWKEAVFRETETLNTTDALDRIHKNAFALRERLGLSVAGPQIPAGLVAEEPAEYKTKND